MIVAEDSAIFSPGPGPTGVCDPGGDHSARVVIGGDRNDSIRLPLGLPANVTTQHLNPPDDNFSGISERSVYYPHHFPQGDGAFITKKSQIDSIVHL